MVEDDSTGLASEPAEKCQHHWDIKPATGYLSQGTCRLCGATKEFRNSATYETWTKATKHERTQQET